MLFTFPNMILGSCTERPLASGRVGIRIRDFTLGFRESRLALVLELASLVALAGAGDTGDTIGIITTFVSIATPMYPTAEFSPIATTSIAPVAFMEPTDFMTEEREGSPVASMDSPHRTPRPAFILEPSAALIMEESPEASPPAASRALAEVSMAEVSEVEASTVAEVATGNSVQIPQTRLIYGERTCA